jgi:hypothetical protein
MRNAEYLGDGVYAQQTPDTGDLLLTTGAHAGSGYEENGIYLDKAVMSALIEYLKRHNLITT